MNTKRSLAITLAAATMSLAAPAVAQSNDVAIQIKGFVTGVLPDGAITDVETDLIGLPAGSQTRATDSVVPTVAVEYFLSPGFSLETICCITPHDVRGTGALAGAELINNAIILPATVTAKVHFDLGGVKPYIGAGPTYFLIFSEDVGADAATLGATDVDLSDELGFVLQAGMDIALNDRGLGLSLDAKRYFIGTTATFRAGNTVALQTEHDLDPWVLSGGLSYRF
ncbi:OmpW family outer membrane protein [Altererythrobacter sp. H2]|uniref:OmpW/AlkL family protein n=1 Tax=Altererythrobacter sp. H2 TaxID=3108391 RepID=UPI002B4BF618|nr:OmpW family outer membrane protein [Altererythrobacter sp. H2]WRK95037.1 OmpW family outer membrane protein [Altererythrobacter sp. H2]